MRLSLQGADSSRRPALHGRMAPVPAPEEAGLEEGKASISHPARKRGRKLMGGGFLLLPTPRRTRPPPGSGQKVAGEERAQRGGETVIGGPRVARQFKEMSMFNVNIFFSMPLGPKSLSSMYLNDPMSHVDVLLILLGPHKARQSN